MTSPFANESANLTHIDIVDTCQLFKDALGCFVDTLVALDETAHQRPFALTGFKGTALKQHLEFALVESEDDTIDGNVEFGILTIIGCHVVCVM